MPAQPDRERTVQLSFGETLFVHLVAGCTVTAGSGNLLLEGPTRWLGETVVRSRLVMARGQTCSFETGGWTTLTAGTQGCTISVATPRTTISCAVADLFAKARNDALSWRRAATLMTSEQLR